MLKKRGKQSLAEKISGVLNAVPESLDPEDQRDETTAKLTSFDSDDQADKDDVDSLISKFRKQNVDLLSDVDHKYVGKRSSRKNIREESDSDEQNSEEEDASATSNELDEMETIDQPSEDEFENSDEESSKVEDNSSDNSDNEDLNLSQNDDLNFKHLAESNILGQVNKGLAVRNQMGIWENLLEIRIQLQKMLLAANKLPQKDYYKEVQKESGNDFTNKFNETKENITKVLNKMVNCQKLMVKNYPETKKLGKGENYDSKTIEASDEEIPSDTDNEDIMSTSENEKNEDEEKEPLKKKIKLDEIESELNTFHKSYKEFRNDTIAKWNSKTRTSITKNSEQIHSVVNQIDHILNDREKVLKKTQLNRTGFKMITSKVEDLNQETAADEEYNTEIFDDTDFYHQLLRELIEVKSADVTDPIQLGRQWIQLQNLRSKMKKKVDTKASKGRKIRYAIHTKLVNFMAPFDNYSWTDEAKNELFGSLFGMCQPKVFSTD